MNPEEKKTETITLAEIFPPQPLAEAEAARVSTEQTLRKLEGEVAAERSKIAGRLKWLDEEIPRMRNKLEPLQDCILTKERAGMDSSSDKGLLVSAKSKITEFDTELEETKRKLTKHEVRAEELIKEPAIAFDKAAESEKRIRDRIGKAVIAHDAHLADPDIGVGPIPKFKTLKEAVRHFYKIGFSLTPEGAANQAFVGDFIRYNLQNGVIEGMIPNSLSWLSGLREFNKLPCPTNRTYIIDTEMSSEPEFENLFGSIRNNGFPRPRYENILCYIEEYGKVLAGRGAAHVDMPGKRGKVDFSDLFGSWEDTLAPFKKELTSASTLDLQATGDLPMLGELIREAWKAAAAAVSSKNNFRGGQGRLTESKINDLIGTYWKAFIQSPWEPSIEGTYALLKHRCARGEIPNVYSFDVQGHFGFRVRTPDHNWIIGEIYCLPDLFNPGEDPDSSKLTNLESCGYKWLAELGSVKFCIKQTPSRT
jgi:hypothetical protein